MVPRQSMKRDEVAAFYKDLPSYAGKTVTVCGWARSIRDSKALGFIDLNDGTSFKGVQVVFEDGKIENFKEIASQNVGAALRVTGTLLETPQAKQPFEIHASEIVVEGASSPEYPLQKKRHTVEFLRTIAHLRPRTNLYSAAGGHNGNVIAFFIKFEMYTLFANTDIFLVLYLKVHIVDCISCIL